jgi:hypothetical protein
VENNTEKNTEQPERLRSKDCSAQTACEPYIACTRLPDIYNIICLIRPRYVQGVDGVGQRNEYFHNATVALINLFNTPGKFLQSGIDVGGGLRIAS